jgi:hypothetical protein
MTDNITTSGYALEMCIYFRIHSPARGTAPCATHFKMLKLMVARLAFMVFAPLRSPCAERKRVCAKYYETCACVFSFRLLYIIMV